MFHYTFDSLSEQDIPEPFLLVSNHTTEFDPIFIGLAAKKPLRFVVSEHIMRKGFGTWFLTTFFDPIVHRKGKDGAKTVMTILKTLRNGENVMLFPEGNRTFNGVTMEFSPATGKMARASGAALVTYRLEGGFFTQPRFSLKRRKGYVRGHLIHVYRPEELKAMTPDGVNRHITEDLYENAYETAKTHPAEFTGKNLAEGIESTLYRCSECGAFGTLHGTGNRIICTCGYEAVYRTDGMIERNGKTTTLFELDRLQTEALKTKLSEDNPEPVFRDAVTIRKIGDDHRVTDEKQTEISAGRMGFSVAKTVYPWDEVKGLTVYSRNFMTVFLGEEERHLDIRGDIGFNALGYYELYQLVKEET